MPCPPIIYIFFNRPDVTRRTFAAIKKMRPRQLYLIADGPRPSKAGDTEKCRETRAIVEGMLDWDCDITRDYTDENLGCGRRLSSGLTSAFATLGEAIVLEDDILPHPDFFPFCSEMLARYRDEPHVHAINGFNPLARYAPSQGAFVPSVFNCIWGWASWQRAWRDYRFDLSEWGSPEAKERVRRHVASELIHQHYAQNFDEMLNEGVDTWDFQWSFTMLNRQRLALASSVNLVENIGFSADATHTTSADPYFRHLRTYPAVPTARERSVSAPDRLHDKLYAEVILSPSQRKISLVRLASRSPLALRFLRRKFAV